MQYIIPSIITFILIFALKKRVNTYNTFIDGAAEGMKIAAKIFPSLLAVVTASQMLRASGAIDMIIGLFAPVTDFLHIPREVMPLALIRPVSGSGSLGVLSDILTSYGADSKVGILASVIMGSTETTFYCLCVYFSHTKVKYTKKVLICALIGDIISILTGVCVINLRKF